MVTGNGNHGNACAQTSQQSCTTVPYRRLVLGLSSSAYQKTATCWRFLEWGQALKIEHSLLPARISGTVYRCQFVTGCFSSFAKCLGLSTCDVEQVPHK